MAFRTPKNNPHEINHHDNGSVPVEAPKKKKKWPWVLAALLLFIIIIAACSPKSSNTSSPAPSPSSSATQEATQESTPEQTQEAVAAETTADKNLQTVELRATSTSTGNVMHGAGGSTNTEQFSGEWNKTVEGVKKSDGYVLTVTGDMMDQNSKVTCEILVDGKVEDQATGTGAAGGATCTLAAKFW